MCQGVRRTSRAALADNPPSLGPLVTEQCMRSTLFVGLLAFAASAPVSAQSSGTAVPAPPSTAAVTNLEGVTVSGVQPGPGLWKVSKGDQVMWVLGTLSPLPEHIQWKTDEVEQTIAESQ